MSPARPRTSNADVVAAGRALLEAGGLGALTMQAVATRVGIRAPSLYKRFASRDALIAAIASATLEELAERLEPLGREPDAAAGLRELALAYREFAHRNPRAFELLYVDLPPGARPSVEQVARAAAPLLHLAEGLAGAERALEAARVMTAFANGFIAMETTGAFRLGGDVERAYRYGVETLVAALERGHRGTDQTPRRGP